MSRVEFCDNRNCSLNDDFKCTVEEVEFDEYATCATARYNDSDLPPDTTIEPKEDKPEKGPASSTDNADKWIKYI